MGCRNYVHHFTVKLPETTGDICGTVCPLLSYMEAPMLYVPVVCDEGMVNVPVTVCRWFAVKPRPVIALRPIKLPALS